MFVGQRLVSIFVANVWIWNEALASFDASNLTLTRFSSPPYDPDSKINALDIVLYSGPFCLITNGHRIVKNILCRSKISLFNKLQGFPFISTFVKKYFLRNSKVKCIQWDLMTILLLLIGVSLIVIVIYSAFNLCYSSSSFLNKISNFKC